MFFHCYSLIWHQAGDVIIKVVAGFLLLFSSAERTISACQQRKQIMMLAAQCSHQFRVLCLADLQSHSPDIILDRQHAGREWWLIIICTIRSVNDIGDGAHSPWWIAYTLPRLLFVPVDFVPVQLRTGWGVRALHPVRGTSYFFFNKYFFQSVKRIHPFNETDLQYSKEMNWVQILKAAKEMKLILLVKQAWHPPSILQDTARYYLNKSLHLVSFACTELRRQETRVYWWATFCPEMTFWCLKHLSLLYFVFSLAECLTAHIA